MSLWTHRLVQTGTKEYDAMSSTTSSSSAAAPRGLEGVVAASTKISHVFGEEGRLVYQGYEISELAGKATYEEVCYLLWHGKLPNATELEQLNKQMRSQRALPEEATATIRALPKDADPMDVLRTAISAAGVGLGISGDRKSTRLNSSHTV